MFLALCGACALGLLDDSDVAPAQTLEVEDDNDPKKKKTIVNPTYNT